MTRDPDLELPQRIAFASSEPKDNGNRAARWTELAVYYLHRPAKPGRHWRAVTRGYSTHPGETLREEEITVGTLDRALTLFDETTSLGRSVIAQARDWHESEGEREAAQMRTPVAPPVVGLSGQGHLLVPLEPGFDGADQDEALRWLYGDELESAKPQTLLARDFGVKESTARMQLGAGRPIMVPLTSALRFFNRPAFKKAREAAE